jgi:multiple sugar transport system permease protein
MTVQRHETLAAGIQGRPRWGHKARSRAGRITVFVLLCLVAVPFVLPFVWMLSTSFKTLDQTLRFPPEWMPNPWQWDNYPRSLFEIVPLYRYFWNTVVYSVPATIFAVLSSAVVAYGFAKFRAPGRQALFILVLSTLLIPYPVVMVPQFILFQRLGWIDTYLPLIVPNLFASPFLIFMLRQFMQGVPSELLDAARIDGAGVLGIFWRVILPLSKLGLIAAAILTFAANWNDYLGPLLFINTRDLFTLQVGLTSFVAHRGTSHWQLLMAASVLATLPVLVIYFAAQKAMMQGIVVTGLK